MSKLQKKLLTGLVLLLIACPIGLIIPDLLKAGDAWGEWDKHTVEAKTGFLPKGMKKDTEIWKAPVKDYSLSERSSLSEKSFDYVLSAIIGVFCVGVVTYGITRIIRKNEKTP